MSVRAVLREAILSDKTTYAEGVTTSSAPSKQRRRTCFDSSDEEDDVKTAPSASVHSSAGAGKRKTFLDESESDDDDSPRPPIAPIPPIIPIPSSSSSSVKPEPLTHSARSRDTSAGNQSSAATPHTGPSHIHTSDSTISRTPYSNAPDLETDDVDGEERPSAALRGGRALAELVVTSGEVTGTLNRYLASCLKPYQQSGVEWLWEQFNTSPGCILGDDMGLGKTVQAISLLAIIAGKTGTSIDKQANKLRRRGQSKDKPCRALIVVPASIVDNWKNELLKWGHFLCVSLDVDTETTRRIIEMAARGEVEIVVCSYERMKNNIDSLAAIAWTVVIWDEAHRLSNRGTGLYTAACKFKRSGFRLALSGTPMSNKMEEVWCLLNVVTSGQVGKLNDFKEHFVGPIKRGMRAGATGEVFRLGTDRRNELMRFLRKSLLRRSKSEVLGDVLKGKREVLVFCELSQLQKRLYMHLLSLPDFDNLKHRGRMCSCGSESIQGRCACMRHTAPLEDNRKRSADPRAVLWRQMHENDEPCAKCPTCVLYPVMNKLNRVASHPSLIQARRFGTEAQLRDQERVARFAREALTSELLEELGGEYQATDFLTACNPEKSGKMLTLQALLDKFTREREKVLVFSYSTKVLDLIEMLVKSKGWSFSRLDGDVTSKHRQELIDKYNQDPYNLIFLLSSKAGGVGINLVSACKVIQFDVWWNPTIDLQAQDRSFRLGQTKAVTVYRLISRGTIEELMYMRQLYKTYLSQAALGGVSCGEDRKFEGVEGESSGELFGIYNLMQYEDCSILQRLQAEYSDELQAESSTDALPGFEVLDTEGIGEMLDRAKENKNALLVAPSEIVEDAGNLDDPKPKRRTAREAVRLSEAAPDIAIECKQASSPSNLPSDEHVQSAPLASTAPQAVSSTRKRKLPLSSADTAITAVIPRPNY